jgi:hypothetical protein
VLQARCADLLFYEVFGEEGTPIRDITKKKISALVFFQSFAENYAILKKQIDAFKSIP